MAVFPIYNILVVPDAYIYFKAEYYRQFAGKPPVQDEKVILIVAKENVPVTELQEDSFYPIGVSGTVREVNRHGFAVVDTQYRVDLQSVYIDPDHTVQLSIARRNDTEDLDPAVEAEKLCIAAR